MLTQSASAVTQHLESLCAHPDRHIGGPGNEAAVAYVERVLESSGFELKRIDFDAIEWLSGSASLTIGGRSWRIHPGPYSLRVAATAELVDAATIDELEAIEANRKILLLHGAVASEQLAPKGFEFFDAPQHRRIIAAIERQAPEAVIAATGHGGGFSGGLYPFPLIEDADVDVPNAYLRDTDGVGLLAHLGEPATIRIDSWRRSTVGRQVIATTGAARGHRVVVFAHLDSKHGSPGALDNAAGVAAMLALAERLREYRGPLRVELVPINGEDDYSTIGEKVYLRENRDRWDEILLGINIDGIGARGHATAITAYGCTKAIDEAVGQVRAGHPRITGGEPWFEGDHGLFLMNARPALAVTSANARELGATVMHGPRDRLELVDPTLVDDLAIFLAELIRGLGSPA